MSLAINFFLASQPTNVVNCLAGNDNFDNHDYHDTDGDDVDDDGDFDDDGDKDDDVESKDDDDVEGMAVEGMVRLSVGMQVEVPTVQGDPVKDRNRLPTHFYRW